MLFHALPDVYACGGLFSGVYVPRRHIHPAIHIYCRNSWAIHGQARVTRILRIIMEKFSIFAILENTGNEKDRKFHNQPPETLQGNIRLPQGRGRRRNRHHLRHTHEGAQPRTRPRAGRHTYHRASRGHISAQRARVGEPHSLLGSYGLPDRQLPASEPTYCR